MRIKKNTKPAGLGARIPSVHFIPKTVKEGYISREQHEREMREQVERIFTVIELGGATPKCSCGCWDNLKAKYLTPSQKKENMK